MIAILSATEHDYYAMPLPFATFSWNMIGVGCLVFIPSGHNKKIELALKYCSPSTIKYEFTSEEKRIPTYSQVIRNFGAAIDWNPAYDTVLITGDSDMAVFSDYFKQVEDGDIHIIGSDLTPKDQYPMCYCAMPISKWKKVMGICKNPQDHVSELINPIEGTNIRGEQWSYDQWYLKKKIDESGCHVIRHNRAKQGTQFADKRADRDGWYFDSYNIIDAHLPRPLTDRINFEKVYELFKVKYPDQNLEWMEHYYNDYLNLL